MAHLRIASAADATAPDARVVDGWNTVKELIDSGEVTGFVVLLDGPRTRDYMPAGLIDAHAMLGFGMLALQDMCTPEE